MGSVKSVSKNFKNLFYENWPKKMQKLLEHASQLNGVPPISAKTLAFPSIL